MRHLGKQGSDVSVLDDIQESIRGVVFQPLDCHSSIEEGNAFLVEESYDFILFEAFVLCVNEMVAVTEPYLALNAPVVVDEIGVEKVHAPTLLGRWETAQEQHFGIGGQERF